MTDFAAIELIHISECKTQTFNVAFTVAYNYSNEHGQAYYDLELHSMERVETTFNNHHKTWLCEDDAVCESIARFICKRIMNEYMDAVTYQIGEQRACARRR